MLKQEAQDWTNHASCFVVVQAHGENRHICLKDGLFDLTLLYSYFSPVSRFSPGVLDGRPKVFVIQACRSEELGHMIFDGVGMYEPTPHDDFLFLYSTCAGLVSLRGLMFQTLTTILRENGDRPPDLELRKLFDERTV